MDTTSTQVPDDGLCLGCLDAEFNGAGCSGANCGGASCRCACNRPRPPQQVTATRDDERWTATRTPGAGWLVVDQDGQHRLALPDVPLTADALGMAMEAWWAGWASRALEGVFRG